jgi:PAS domain S-box-containing protein
MLTSRRAVLAWALVAVLSFPAALLIGLSTHPAGLPSLGVAAITVSLMLMLVRMVAWGLFLRYWKKTERLRNVRANNRLSTIAESCNEVLWEVRGDRVTYVAPAVTAYLGYAPDELIGKNSASILASFEHARAQRLRQTCAAAACGWKDEEYVFVAKDGELRSLLCSGLALTNEVGKVVGFAGTLRVLDARSERRASDQIRQHVQDLITNQSIDIVFQPIVDSASGAAVGAEALSRFRDDTMSPDQWFSAAARVGLGVVLEVAALQQALDLATATLPRDLFLSVNVSPATLLSGQLDAIFDEAGWAPSRLVVEITEHVRVEDYERLTQQTKALRRRGLRIAVDDAGAGYSSFRHILALKPDYIKLDRGLVANIDSDPGKRALVKAVTAFAGDIGATVIAEGIETAAELQTAIVLGVQGAQGFYIADPTEVTEWPASLRLPPSAALDVLAVLTSTK